MVKKAQNIMKKPTLNLTTPAMFGHCTATEPFDIVWLAGLVVGKVAAGSDFGAGLPVRFGDILL